MKSAAGTLLVPANTPFFFTPAGNNLAPAFGDLDGDGDLNTLVGSNLGTFTYRENIGDALTPTYVQRTGALNPLDGENLGSSSAPTLGDGLMSRSLDDGVIATIEFLYLERRALFVWAMILAIPMLGLWVFAARGAFVDPARMAIVLIVAGYFILIMGGADVMGRFRQPSMPFVGLLAAIAFEKRPSGGG